MRLSLRRRPALPDAPGVHGAVRVDPRTKNLTKRLRPGEIAVIDHLDIDRVSAEALAACKPVAVLNAARSTSGRYPNLGPDILLGAGITLVDDLGPDVLTITEGRQVRVLDGAVYDGDRLVAEGTVQDETTVAAAMADARAGLAMQLESFAANTMDYLRRERDLLLDGVGVPDIRTPIDGRQVLIVVRGYHYKEDLVALRHYVKEYRPVLIGVDGGADAILEMGWTPDLIVGDMDSVSDGALTCGAE
ncbi:MAG TPA: putative cytokinetic ring protein SteA, partial [Actinotalea sp.]|nr:putative cytokinetic ring protein SteA [Actinotalea sp.]